MTGHSFMPLHWHEDPALFSEAINFTASQTGFAARLIEKDYFCSLILALLAAADPNPLVFKGGTCLSKVYAGFYRLSEDLDFAVPLETDSSRGERRRLGVLLKETVATILERTPSFSEAEPLSGQNESRQYVGSLKYQSLLNNQDETIRIEISLREPLRLLAVSCGYLLCPSEVQFAGDEVNHGDQVLDAAVPSSFGFRCLDQAVDSFQ